MNLVALALIAIILLAGALAAALLPKLIHAALAVVVAFIGTACVYFWLGAEFLGVVQIFVYIGAVAILIIFTILLTKPDERSPGFRLPGFLVALAVFAALVWAILSTPGLPAPPEAPALSVKQIGDTLTTDYVWPLMGIGVLLTAALIGALVVVMEEPKEKESDIDKTP
jgi:NADH-quinone oxidoreductase subunit J